MKRFSSLILLIIELDQSAFVKKERKEDHVDVGKDNKENKGIKMVVPKKNAWDKEGWSKED